ncbi:phage portal protein [Roseibium salinum]|uniref:Phage portal protein n=1 Tax=Roseibium salinum TaxID=1604349 RepID=A0ABT3R0I0_9HYPH|nr:phage portal protein [Roseibium sp. DSM 29163]MCX2722603.1 phage portal protein [Roseibium sp. DSM 29163]
MPGAGYLRNTGSGPAVFMAGPALRDISDDIRQAWTPAAARTIEALQNNGWIAGGVEAAISTIIGTGLQLNATPDHEAIGMTASEAAKWARRVERRYEARCRNAFECDAGGRWTAGQMEAAHLRQFFATGEGITQFLMFSRPGVESRTRARLLPSHWLCRDTDVSERLHQGVRLDRHGAPVSYRFRLKDGNGITSDVEYRARDRFGRPIIKHIFDGLPGQHRGITVFAPVLKTIQNYDRLSGSTLAASFLHAMFAATIESDYPTEDVLSAIGGETPMTGFMKELTGWHSNVDIKLGDYGRIPHLFAGEKLNLQGAKYPNANYEPLANFLLREIARCLGCLFEDLTGDYRGATYSSLQNGIAKIWPITQYRRKHIAVPYKQADYEAWLEEEIDTGRTPFPGGIRGFLNSKAAACRAEWRGPPKPVADELKAARADEIYYGLGVKTQGRIAADRGDDIEDIHEGLERERQSRNERNLPHPGERSEDARIGTDKAIDEERDEK